MGEEPAIMTHGQLQPPGRRTGDRGRLGSLLLLAGGSLREGRLRNSVRWRMGADLPAEHGSLGGPAGSAEGRGGGGGGATAGGDG